MVQKKESILAPPRIDSSRESEIVILVPERTLSLLKHSFEFYLLLV
jgi:hypothetical protein